MAPKRKAATPKTPEVAPEPAPEVEVPAVPAAPVEVNEEAAPAPVVVVPIAGTPAEVYTQLQEVIGDDSAKIVSYVPQVVELMQAAENPATSLLLRVKVLELVSRVVQHVHESNALKKIVTSLVKVISGEDNTQKLLIAALECFRGLGPVSMLDKSLEYLSREGADILMQVMIDKDAFPEPVRQTASKSLDALTTSAFRSVVTKLIHWISDDREQDEEEQLSKERHLALARLARLAFAPSMRSHWTEEMQQYTLSLIQRILGTVDGREFAQLVRVAGHLPIVHDKGGVPLLEAYLTQHKLDSDRELESFGLIARQVAAGSEFDIVSELEKAKLLSKDLSAEGAHSVLAARALVVAARITDAAGAEKLFTYIFDQLEKLVGAGAAFPANLSVLEALLFAAAAIAPKKSMEALQRINGEAFNQSMVALSALATESEKLAVFAVKKRVQQDAAEQKDADLVAALRNIKTLSSAFAAKHLPMGELKESWIGKPPMPHSKRARDPATRALPAPGAKRHDRSPSHPRKKARTQSSGGRGQSQGRNRNGGKSNNNNNRRTGRRH